MMRLHLLPVRQCDVEMALEGYPELLSDVELSPHAGFWLGSVSMSDPHNVEEFLSLAKQHRFEEMTRHAAIAHDMIYGLLVRRRKPLAGMRVFVLIMGMDLFEKATCLYTDVVEGVGVLPPKSNSNGGHGGMSLR